MDLCQSGNGRSGTYRGAVMDDTGLSGIAQKYFPGTGS